MHPFINDCINLHIITSLLDFSFTGCPKSLATFWGLLSPKFNAWCKIWNIFRKRKLRKLFKNQIYRYSFLWWKLICKATKKKKRKPLFYGRVDLPSRVGWSGLFFCFLFFFFKFLVQYYLKNTEFSGKKSDFFLQKILKKIFWFIFNIFQIKF